MGLWAWLKSKYIVIVNRKTLQPCMRACRPAGRVHAMHKNEIMTLSGRVSDMNGTYSREDGAMHQVGGGGGYRVALICG